MLDIIILKGPMGDLQSCVTSRLGQHTLATSGALVPAAQFPVAGM